MDYTIEIVAKDTVQMHRQLLRVAMKKMRVVFTPVLCFMVLGYLILALESRSAEDLTTLGITVLLSLVFWFMPDWMGYLSYRKKVKYYSGDLPENVAQFGEEILIKDGDSKYNISYDKIKFVKIMDSCIVLRLQDGRNFGIPNGPFTKGSLSEMLVLLKEKCPQAKLPKGL